VAVLPLGPKSIIKIVEKMRDDEYRSAGNYLSVAKRRHFSADWPWGTALQQSYTDAMRMAKRKLGPPTRAAAFDLLQVAVAFVLGRFALCAVLLPVHAAMAAALFMMRLLELAVLRCRDIMLDGSARTVAVRINSSKTDLSDKGFKFRWSCTCGLPSRPPRAQAMQWLLCPYHVCEDVAVKLHEFMPEAAMRPTIVQDTDLPFFRTKRGAKITSEAMSRFLRETDAMHNIKNTKAVVFPDEKPAKFSGHSCRRAGAQHWLRAGLGVDLVRRLARWQSQAIEAYIEQMPLENLGPMRIELQQKLAIGEMTMEIANETVKLINARLPTPAARSSGSCAQVANGNGDTPTKFVVSKFPGKPKRIHLIVRELGEPQQWHTKCNYHYMRSGTNVEVVECLRAEAHEFGALCARGCFR
jgi:integrase